ncbi:MAG: hypothetical protein KAS35_03370, partial [Candidatus Marinimicrobia bacterium]|nr:hypothetical protein [Candidatus Neomarinimicrobiota bacterium]
MISAVKNTKNKTIRVGIMCNGLNFSAWEAETIRHLINTKGVSLELLIGDANRIEPIWNNNKNFNLEHKNFIKKVLRRVLRIHQQLIRFLKTQLWHRYQRFVNNFFPADCD